MLALLFFVYLSTSSFLSAATHQYFLSLVSTISFSLLSEKVRPRCIDFLTFKMEDFYKKWLEENKRANREALQSNTQLSSQDAVPSTSSATIPAAPSTSSATIPAVPSTSSATTPASITPITSSSNKFIYENESMELSIEKTNFLRQKKFKIHDHLFHMKIKLKNSNTSAPLLRNILQFLQIAFEHILQNIRTLYNKDDHNIAFLTLFQKPMINGLNTGGFDIQESSSEMVQRVLSMLEQFLVSNQSLQLDDTFKVYLKVLSIRHMNQKKITKPKRGQKRTKDFYTNKKKPTRQLFGSRIKPIKKYNYFWALDVPNSFPNEPEPNVFKDMCLLSGTILGLLQNKYFKSKRCDKRFLYTQYINSVNKIKQNRAGKILLEEINNLKKLTGLDPKGPYQLEVTMKKLSETYQCQFFIFDSVHNSNKLTYMYPENYEDNLIPIYFYQPLNEKNHLVYIRNLKSYFKANVRVCFGCKKTFQTHDYRHLCPKRKCCFSCRRFFQTKDTFVHEKLSVDFCDKDITTENKLMCPICNVTCYSQHCFKGHKRICNGQGTFGFKCLKCNKFTYRYSDKNGANLRESHKCNELKKCKFCREFQEENHLCKLKKESASQLWPQLAFLVMEYFDNSLENCSQCMTFNVEKNTEHLCEAHQTTSENADEPILAIIYREEEIGTFRRYVCENFETAKVSKTTNSFSFSYDKFIKNKHLLTCDKSKRKTEDFKTNLQQLNEKETNLLSDKLFQLVSSWQNTTFICQDEDSICYVRFAFIHYVVINTIEMT